MFENSTVKTKGDFIDNFGSLPRALNIGNKYRTEPLTLRQVIYQLKNGVLSEEWQAFWSNVAFYEQRQQNLFGDANDC